MLLGFDLSFLLVVVVVVSIISF